MLTELQNFGSQRRVAIATCFANHVGFLNVGRKNSSYVIRSGWENGEYRFRALRRRAKLHEHNNDSLTGNSRARTRNLYAVGPRPCWHSSSGWSACRWAHGVLPWAPLRSLRPRYGWTAGYPGTWNWLGLIPIAAGTAVLIWHFASGLARARELPERTQRPLTPPFLMTTGPNAYKRNPLYVAELPRLARLGDPLRAASSFCSGSWS